MQSLAPYLETYCTLHWWNMGSKTLGFKGTLAELLKNQSITYTRRKTENEWLFTYYFRNSYGVSFKQRGTLQDFPHIAKQMVQMELVRMGDKSTLYVQNAWRPTVTVNH